MDFSGFNLAELVVASLTSMAIGYFWYGDYLFGKKWRGLQGLDEIPKEKGHSPKVYVLALIGFFVLAWFLSIFSEIAMMLGTKALYAGLFGIFLCLGFVATTLGINYAFSGKSFKLYLIDLGYFMVSFFVMGLIVGAWH